MLVSIFRRKKAFAILFIMFNFVLVFSMCKRANAATHDDVKNWLDYEINTFAPQIHGSGECVDFCNYYLTNCWGTPAIIAHAKDWRCPLGWIPIDLNGNPDNLQMGDLIVEDYQPFGHVMVYYAKEGAYHKVVDQNSNYGTIKYPAKHTWWNPLSNPTLVYRPPFNDLTFENYDKYYEIGQNSAHFGTRIYGSVYSASEVGCALYDSNRALIARSQDGAYREGNVLIHHFIIGSGSPDINVVLSPATKYYYQFYVIANGDYRYSDYYEFTTLPPDNPQFTYENYGKYQEIGNDYAQFGTKIYGSVGIATSVGCELYNQNKGIIGSCEDGAYMEGDCLIHYYSFKSGSPDINVTLSSDTKYYYRYYVIAAGKKYYSPYNEFRTSPLSSEFTYENYDKFYELGETTAHFGVKIYGDSVSSVSAVGCELYNSGKELLGSCQDGAYLEGNCLIHHYYFQPDSPDIAITLIRGTDYYYRYYVVLSGNKFYSNYFGFRTMGASYTITYDANGGTNAPAAQHVTGSDASARVNLSSVIPTLEGYDFLGWSKNINSNVATYQPGQSYSGSEDVTFYAVWNSIPLDTVSWENSLCLPFKRSAYISVDFAAPVTGTFSSIRLEIRNKNGNLVASKSETSEARRSRLNIWYEVYSETGTQLETASDYTYQIFVTFDNNVYSSPVYEFTTENADELHFGIDVSSHNGNINWDIVASYIDYAIIRCGYGGNYESQDDAYWATNVAACERLGIPYGVYIYSYAENDEEALDEAEHVLRLLEGHQPSLPVYYDLEDERTVGRLKGEQVLSQVAVFSNFICKAGYNAGVYSNLTWWNGILKGYSYSADTKWLAAWNSGSYADLRNNCALWQFTSNGSLPGIDGRVDLNYSSSYIFGSIGTTDIPVPEPDFILPSSVTAISEETFVGCNFKYVVLSEKTTIIGNKAFANCSQLRHIYIPESTTSISRYAFDNVEDLTIHGKEGSYAEFYANKYGFIFDAEEN